MTTATLRVVLDTNLVVSALVFGNRRLSKLRHAWQNSLCQPLVSSDTAEELVRVFAYPKFRLSREEQLELLADFLPYAETVTIPPQIPKLPPCRDPHDVKFLELAAVGKAALLVTGDEDLLAVTGKLPFRIITADMFLRQLGMS